MIITSSNRIKPLNLAALFAFLSLVFISSTFQITVSGVTHMQQTRSSRSPDSERIQRWKLAFSGDLAPLPPMLPTVTCNWALHNLCLKHVSCRELWTLFRRNCLVDAQNNCLMTNKNDCWQSYEGISWTGLGSCTCPGNNSDCHWIRLQTNYNKCVYLLSNDATWRAELSSPEKFYASSNRAFALAPQQTFNNGNNKRAPGYGQELGVDKWKNKQLNWQQHRRIDEMGKNQGSISEEQMIQRNEQIKEVKRKDRLKVEEEQQRKASLEEEERQIRIFKEQEEEKENMKRAKIEEDRRKRIEAEEERMKKEEMAWRRTEEERRAKSEEEDRNRRIEERRRMMEEEGKIRKERRKKEDEEAKAKRLKEEMEWKKKLDENRRKHEDEEENKVNKTTINGEETEKMQPKSHTYGVTAHQPSWELNRTDANANVGIGSNNNGRNIYYTLTMRKEQPANGHDHESPLSSSSFSLSNNSNEWKWTTKQNDTGRITSGIRDSKHNGNNISGNNNDDNFWTTSKIMEPTVSTNTLPVTTPTTTMITPTEIENLVTQAEPPPISTAASKKHKQSPYNRQQQLNIQKDDATAGIYGIDANEQESIPAGTCQEVLEICEKDESACKWHLSELLIKCPAVVNFNPCQRSGQCSAAISRFVRFVSSPLTESMLFCTQAEGNYAEMPIVLMPHQLNCSDKSSNKKPKARWSCTQTARMCRAEPNCSRRLSNLRTACTYTNINSSASNTSASLLLSPSCTAQSLAKCRSALVATRGTWLDEPCHCSSTRNTNEEECHKWEMTLWPGNPCIGQVRQDFNELFLAGQLQIEPTTKSPRAPPSAKSTKYQQLMELGDEVTLFPPEEHNKTEETHKAEKVAIRPTSKEKKTNRMEKGEQENRAKKKTDGKMGANQSKNGRANTLTKGTTRSRTTTTTTTTAVTANADIEEVSFGDVEITDDNDTIKPMQIGTNEALTKGNRLSYELAMNINETSSKNNGKATGNIEAITKKPIEEVTDNGKKSQQRTTTGRQPLPEFDFITQKPPSEGDSCRTRNIDGEWVEHYPESVFRQFHDWAGRCSSWCECSVNGTAQCHELGCLSDVLCEARHTTVGFGQRLYLADRGACQCHDGRFICDSSELRPELGPGLYISLGYSKSELDLIREKVPKPILEKSGLISQSSSLVKDLATRLQFALERVLPDEMRCRVAVLEHFPPEQVVLMQLQWFGVDTSMNQTRPKWHNGKMEKHCSAYVRELELTFLLERAARYQLLLSTIKQIRIIDLLDVLSQNAALRQQPPLLGGSRSFIRLLIQGITWIFLIDIILPKIFFRIY